eukprot:Skav234300  [mRNA]  locus=scaffold2271:335773:340812:+ [translate_table: standard]
MAPLQKVHVAQGFVRDDPGCGAGDAVAADEEPKGQRPVEKQTWRTLKDIGVDAKVEGVGSELTRLIFLAGRSAAS